MPHEVSIECFGVCVTVGALIAYVVGLVMGLLFAAKKIDALQSAMPAPHSDNCWINAAPLQKPRTGPATKGVL